MHILYTLPKDILLLLYSFLSLRLKLLLSTTCTTFRKSILDNVGCHVPLIVHAASFYQIKTFALIDDIDLTYSSPSFTGTVVGGKYFTLKFIIHNQIAQLLPVPTSFYTFNALLDHSYLVLGRLVLPCLDSPYKKLLFLKLLKFLAFVDKYYCNWRLDIVPDGILDYIEDSWKAILVQIKKLESRLQKFWPYKFDIETTFPFAIRKEMLLINVK